MTISLSALQTRALVLDIEGTTTPVEFVYQVLFPYARAHVAEYVEHLKDSAACRETIALLRREHAADLAPIPDVAQDLGERVPTAPLTGVAQDFSPAVVVAYVHWLMDRDRKSPGLKALQGLIWQDGYRRGELRGQVYPDVAPALDRWRTRGLDIYIYSSGSVLAQQLLFGSIETGGLTKFLNGYFDTAVGPKTAAESYAAIAEGIRVAPPEILFVSDVVQELDAAREASLRTVLCVRAGADAQPRSNSHPVIRAFDEIVD